MHHLIKCTAKNSLRTTREDGGASDGRYAPLIEGVRSLPLTDVRSFSVHCAQTGNGRWRALAPFPGVRRSPASSAAFMIAWETTHTRCPQGQARAKWTPGRDGSSDLGTLRLFFHQHFKPVGACAGDSIAPLGFPGHFIPAPFFNEGTALVGIDFL